MDKYLAAEQRLAELLGYIKVGDNWLNPVGRLVNLPTWTACSLACLELIDAHRVELRYPTMVTVEALIYTGSGGVAAAEDVQSHPDRLTALRYAVVQAVIRKLEVKS